MKKKYKRGLLLILLFLFLLVIILVIPKVFKKEEQVVNVVDSIEKYGYNLEDRDTALMKGTYNELKEILKKDVDKENYAKTLSKLFIIDLFTIDNKISKYDVGGSEFVYTKYQDNFKLNVEDTLYKTLKSNLKGNRKQDLPVVKTIEVTKCEKSKFKIGKEEYTSYVTSLNWTYNKDLGFDKSATVISIEEEDKLYIVEYKVV
ncbi:MAG: hypothetical protein RSG95_00650 [Bacilli bacterium]